MKKLFSILLTSTILSLTPVVMASNTDESLSTSDTIEQNVEVKTKSSISISLSIKPGFCHFEEREATLKLSDGEKEYYKSFKISDASPSQDIVFEVDEHEPGKVYYLTPEKEIGKLFKNETVGTNTSPILIDSEKTDIHYIPSVHNAIDIAINGHLTSFPMTARNIGLHVIVPFDDMVNALNLSYTIKDGTYYIETPISTLILDQNNNAYVKKIHNDKVQLSMPTPPVMISGKLFVPISLFETAYNLSLIQQWEGDKPTLYVATAPVDNIYVNSVGLSSQTDYLIWVSKSEYKVRVYSGHKGNWNLINSFTCAIGAPSTPTCEGTYRYYQTHEKWDYGSYYVGPIMRFNGGYAIHSTLIYKDGTPKDNRVGMRLSLGCVRLQPQDINWLHSIIPLYTTIHITG